MAIQDDFRIYPFSKVIRHDSGTTVYSVTAFYSWLMDFFDEPPFQSYETPIKFNTPTSFSMLNGWFLDNGDGSDILQYLTGASIDSIDYTTVADPVYMMDVDAETTAFVAGDLDEEILDDAGAVGPLLSFKANYPSATTARFWVRDTNSNGTILSASSITMTAPGLASYTGNTLGPSVNGEEVYSNIFTLASFPGTPDPQVYVYQNHPVSGNGRIRVAEWSGLTNFDRGSIDVLIPIQLGGTEIDSGNITTFVRQTGDTFTFVESDLTGGARTPLATETLSDAVNVDEAEHFLLYDASDTGSFTVGDVIMNQSDAATSTPPTWYAEVVAVQEFTDTTTGVIAVRGLRGSIADNDGIYVSTVQEATANGTPGGSFFTWDAATTDFVAGDVGKPFTGGTSGATRILRGFEIFTATTDGAAVLDTGTDAERFTTVDGHNLNTPALHDALYIEHVENDSWAAASGGSGTGAAIVADALYSAPFLNSTIISDFTDVTIAHINGTVVVDTVSGLFEIGERVTWSGGGPAICLNALNTGDVSLVLGNVEDETNLNTDPLTITGQASGQTCETNGTGGLTDANTSTYAFTQQSAATYAVVVEGGAVYNAGRALQDIYKYWQYYVRDGQVTGTRDIYTSDGSSITAVAADEYIKAKSAYTATKPAPYGTLAGTLLFGAQGVWVQGTAAVDDLRLTDDAGAAQQGTPSVTVQVTNTRVSDVVTCYLEDGSTGLPDKAQFSMPGGEIVSDSTIVVTGAIPVDTPAVGTINVVDTSFAEADNEHRYRYASWTGSTFTLKTEVTGTADGATADQTLQDTGVFTAGAVARGDIIRNTLDASIGYIVSRDSDNQVTTTQMRDSSGTVVPWAVSDTFEVNSVVNAIAAADTAYVPYLDEIEDTGTDGSPGTVSDTLLFVSARSVVIRVRNNLAATEIVPFVTPSDITSGGMTVAVIRTEDTVTT